MVKMILCRPIMNVAVWFHVSACVRGTFLRIIKRKLCLRHSYVRMSCDPPGSVYVIAEMATENLQEQG